MQRTLRIFNYKQTLNSHCTKHAGAREEVQIIHLKPSELLGNNQPLQVFQVIQNV